MSDEKNLDPKGNMSIVDHLEEMRWRLMKCLVAVGVFIPFTFWQAKNIFIWLIGEGFDDLIITAPMGAFFLKMKIGIFAGLILALPVLAYQLWQFVVPGLFKSERKYVSTFAIVSTCLFLIGALFAHHFIYPMLVIFATKQAEGVGKLMPDINKILSLVVMLMVGFGVMFQLPIVVFALIYSGLLSVKQVAYVRPYIYVGIFVLSAVLTPPDIISQMAMGFPTIFLFELSLILSKVCLRKRMKELAVKKAEEEAKRKEQEEKERLELEERQAKELEAADDWVGEHDDDDDGGKHGYAGYGYGGYGAGMGDNHDEDFYYEDDDKDDKDAEEESKEKAEDGEKELNETDDSSAKESGESPSEKDDQETGNGSEDKPEADSDKAGE